MAQFTVQFRQQRQRDVTETFQHGQHGNPACDWSRRCVILNKKNGINKWTEIAVTSFRQLLHILPGHRLKLTLEGQGFRERLAHHFSRLFKTF